MLTTAVLASSLTPELALLTTGIQLHDKLPAVEGTGR